jgi:hypothetical protein
MSPEQTRIHKLIIQLMRVYFAIPNPKRMREVVRETREQLDAYMADYDSGALFESAAPVNPENRPELKINWVERVIAKEQIAAELKLIDDAISRRTPATKNYSTIDLARAVATTSHPVNPLFPVRVKK